MSPPPNPATSGQQVQRDRRAPESASPHRTAKVIELIGNSPDSFEGAVKNALKDASHSVRHISGAEVVRSSVKCEEGEIIEYRVDLRVAFGIEHGS